MNDIVSKESLIGHYISVKTTISYSNINRGAGVLMGWNRGAWMQFKDELIFVSGDPDVINHSAKKCQKNGGACR